MALKLKIIIQFKFDLLSLHDIDCHLLFMFKLIFKNLTQFD